MKKLAVTFSLVAFITVYLFAQAKPTVLKASVDRGKKVYDITCSTCHQKNGAGVPRLNPPLIKTEYVLGDKARIINIVLKGLDEAIEINGEEYANAMPSFAQLTDQQIADVLTYVRNSFGNKASLVSSATVKAERAKNW